MTPAEWSVVKNILNEALDCPPGERSAYLDKACAGNTELRRRVESLIEADGRTWSLLEAPAVASSSLTSSIRPPAAGDRIGAHEILKEIGHGGMGIVYLARRADQQFERYVAIKVAQSGLAGDPLERRFRSERQIVANLDHPNIARLLDGGTTSDGRAYLVMEYVEGEPLTQWCDAHGLGVRERLEIFLEVCAAVQYAHQHLVVHRDLKPANILVTEQRTVKLLDFGIAKLIDPDLADGADRTGTLFRLLTPDYASPEQVRGGPISTSSDVYALGVVLYELLTGEKPLKLTGSAPAEMLWIVNEKEPARPSEVAKGGASKELAGDLDTIILTALRKEPGRRFASANAMADDIRRHLSGLPVEARTDTFGYRAGKFVRRHRAGVTAAALVGAALAGGLVMTLREARRARAAEARAERRFNDVRQLANSVVFEIHDQIRDLPGSTPARQALVRRALEFLDKLAQERGDDQALTRELAAAYQRVGDVQGDPNSANLGDTAGALKSYRKALELRESLAARQPREAEIQRELATTLDTVGDVLGQSGEQAEQLAAYKRSLAVREALLAADPKGALSRRGLATSYHRIASVLVDQGKYQEALVLWCKESELFEAVWKESPSDTRAQRNVALSYKYMGGTLERLEDRSAALELYRKAVALDEARSAADPTNAAAKIDLSFSYGALGQCRAGMGDLDGAVQTYAKALQIREGLVAADPKDVNARRALGRAYRRMGGYLLQKGDGPSALEYCTKAVEIAEAVARQDPANKAALEDVAAALDFLGETEATLAEAPKTPSASRVSHRREACRTYERSLAIWTQLRNQNALSAQNVGKPNLAAAALARCPGHGP
jgi:non-specific serine/threonine protein kinase/serine/threonine-protein kinase